jgi:hypothetical protein
MIAYSINLFSLTNYLEDDEKTEGDSIYSLI